MLSKAQWDSPRDAAMTDKVEGETCFCDDGKCMLCMGTGRTADFFYKGRPVSFHAESWKRWLMIGIRMH